jgi:CheY-like chemotaxis protein
MDLVMPVMNGWEFRAEQLRDPLLSKVPVIVFSARDDVENQASRVSASACLRKPFHLDDLFDAIGKIHGNGV